MGSYRLGRSEHAALAFCTLKNVVSCLSWCWDNGYHLSKVITVYGMDRPRSKNEVRQGVQNDILRHLGLQ